MSKILDIIIKWHDYRRTNVLNGRVKLTEHMKVRYDRTTDQGFVTMKVTLKFKSLDDAMMFKLTM
mgnify:FL=1